MKEIPFAIERLERDGETILLQAWALPPQNWSGPFQLVIRGKSSDVPGAFWEFVLEPNRERADVVRTLGLDDSVQPCGFFFYGTLPDGVPESLWLTWASGSHLLLSIKPPLSGAADTPSASIWGGWRYLMKRAWALVRDGQWHALQAKIGKHLRLALASGSAKRNIARLSNVSDTVPVDCLVIDHDLGGGANQYRYQLIADQLAQGRSLALLTFSLLGLRYVLQYFDPARGVDRPIIMAKLRWQNVLEEIDRLQPRQIFYNNAVSFPEAQKLAYGIALHKEGHPSCQLTLAVHDFFMICPSQHLMNAEGKFCHIPKDLSICTHCLDTSTQDLTPLYRKTDIALWRQNWASLLNVADEILVFDPSSADILCDVFTDIPAAKISLRPHVVPPLSREERKLIYQWKSTRSRKSGCIGIVGNISSAYKGNKMVHALSNLIAEAGLPYTIVCIGQTTPKPAARGIYRETGSYRKEDLTRLIIENDVDVFLFCSNGPETFSYVLHEIEAYGLPIAAYPIGAQAPFLQRYPFAIPLPPDCSAQEVLTRLMPYLGTKKATTQPSQ